MLAGAASVQRFTTIPALSGTARGRYGSAPDAGSAEARLADDLRPRDWLEAFGQA